MTDELQHEVQKQQLQQALQMQQTRPWAGLGKAGPSARSPRRGRSRSGSVSVIEAVGEIFADYASGRTTPHLRTQQKLGQYGLDGDANDDDDDDGGNVEEEKARQVADAHATLTACQAAASKAELSRIYELWQHAKRELRAKADEIAELRASFGRTEVEARLSRLSMAENEELLREVSVLRERLRTNAHELQTARTENDRLSCSYEKLSDELRAIREAQETARQRASALEARAEKLERENHALEDRNTQLAGQLDKDERAGGHDDAISHNRLAAHETKAQALALDLQRAEDAREAAQAALETQELLVKDRDLEIARLHRKVDLQNIELKGDARKSALDRQREAQARIDHLRVDNARLLSLLRSTPAFKHFMSLCEVTDDADLTYLPSDAVDDLPDHHALHASYHLACKTTTTTTAGSPRNTCSPSSKAYSATAPSTVVAWGPSHRQDMRSLGKSYGGVLKGDRAPHSSAVSESEHWVPTEAVRIMVAFRNRYLPHAPLDLADHLLRDLGKVWHAHHTKLLKRQKTRHQRQIQDVKRRVQHQTSYEEVMNRSRVSRHVAQVDEPSLASCLREIDQLNVQLDQLRQENDELNEQVGLARKAASPRRGSTGTLILQPEIRDELEALLFRMDSRMRDCMKRVANLHTAHAGDPDLLHLIERAHAAMMEDLGEILSDLHHVLGK